MKRVSIGTWRSDRTESYPGTKGLKSSSRIPQNSRDGAQYLVDGYLWYLANIMINIEHIITFHNASSFCLPLIWISLWLYFTW